MIYPTILPKLMLEISATTTVTSAGALSSLANLSPLEQLLFGACIVILLAGCYSLYSLSTGLMELQKIRLLEKHNPELIKELSINDPIEVTEGWWSRIYKRLTDNVPIDEEADILLDHNYDGVMELDNNLPPWWKAIFYISMAFAPLYLYLHHFSDRAMSSQEAYVVEMEDAKAEINAFLATQANLVDETNVTLLSDQTVLASGKIIFDGKCAACHGMLGEGGIGPNLTDVYWLHGGSVKDVFKTIKYGVPEMGMIAWQKDIRPADMQAVTSYIISLGGTNPPNAKEAQGEEYIPEETPIAAEAEATNEQGK